MGHLPNMSAAEICVLEQFNSDEVHRLSPVITYLITLCVLGTIGNTVSLYIYARHYEKSNARSFFIYLCSTELFSSAFVMPIEIYILFKNFTMFEDELCQSISFLNIVQVELSTTVLLLIAVDRYRKVCYPFSWQVSERTAYVTCIFFCFLACVVAGPCVYLYKTHTTIFSFNKPYDTDCYGSNGHGNIMNITVYECTVSNKPGDKKYKTAYSVYWLCVSIIYTVSLAFMYWRILVHIRRQSMKFGRVQPRKNTLATSVISDDGGASTSEMKAEFVSINTEKPCASAVFTTLADAAIEKPVHAESSVTENKTGLNIYAKNEGNINKENEDLKTNSDESENKMAQQAGAIRISVTQYENTETGKETPQPVEKNQNQLKEPNGEPNKEINGKTAKESNKQDRKKAKRASKADIQARNVTRKVTLTMFIITLSTIICFTPYFVLELSRSSTPHFLESLTESQRVGFAYCMRSYYLKSIINPMMYGVFDTRFNAALRKVLSRIKCWA